MILEELRKAGLRVEPHSKWFRHNTQDERWLEVVGEKKWIVLMRDKMIARRVLELDALINAGVRTFVLVEGSLPDVENAKIIIGAIPKIFAMIAENRFPFIARVRKDSAVSLWKTEPKIQKGVHRNRRKK